MDTVGLAAEDPGRPLWVRWSEWSAWTQWMKADRVSVSDSWLVVDVDADRTVMVPDHIVRGRVEIQYGDEKPTGST